MIKKLLITFVLSFNIFSNADAGTCCNTPTVWTLKNLTKNPVKLSCKLESSVAWSGKPILFETNVIAAHTSTTQKWGKEWYNDGMGMIPGKWQCKNASKSSQEVLSFSTDWGENVIVLWKETQSSIARIDREPDAPGRSTSKK